MTRERGVMLTALGVGTRVHWRLYPSCWGSYHSELIRERYSGWLSGTVMSCDGVWTELEVSMLGVLLSVPQTRLGVVRRRLGAGRLATLKYLARDGAGRSVLGPAVRASNVETLGMEFARRPVRVRVRRAHVVPSAFGAKF